LNSGNPVARIKRRMSYYRFIARTDDSRSESLGIMDLRHDGDARSFASRVIGDMMHTHPGGLWHMDP
jgi:hypothetical protein